MFGRILAATKQLYEWISPSIRLSACPSVKPFWQCSSHCIIMEFSGEITINKSDVLAKSHGQRSRSQRSKPNLAVSGLWLKFEFVYCHEMMYKAWCGIGEVPYCFSESSVKFQCRTAQKITDLEPNCAFLDCNSSLISLMAMKWCTKL